MIDESPIYFKIPSFLKDDFDVICKNSKTPKSLKLYEFIRNYVNETKRNDPELLKRSEPKKPIPPTDQVRRPNPELDPFYKLGW